MTTTPSSRVVYRLVEDETREVLVATEDIRGFFTDREPPVTATFVGVRHIDLARRKAESTELEILNPRHEVIGSYYVGRVSRLTTDPDRGDGFDASNAEFLFSGSTCEYPEAKDIWLRWASPKPIEYGEWARYPAALHETWLHVVQTAWAVHGRDEERYRTDEVVQVDGRQMTTEPGFYCALGEAVNGPGGYFGSNTGALAELLFFYRKAGHRFQLLWDDSVASREVLGEQLMDHVLALMRESGVVEVVLR